MLPFEPPEHCLEDLVARRLASLGYSKADVEFLFGHPYDGCAGVTPPGDPFLARFLEYEALWSRSGGNLAPEERYMLGFLRHQIEADTIANFIDGMLIAFTAQTFVPGAEGLEALMTELFGERVVGQPVALPDAGELWGTYCTLVASAGTFGRVPVTGAAQMRMHFASFIIAVTQPASRSTWTAHSRDAAIMLIRDALAAGGDVSWILDSYGVTSPRLSAAEIADRDRVAESEVAGVITIMLGAIRDSLQARLLRVLSGRQAFSCEHASIRDRVGVQAS